MEAIYENFYELHAYALGAGLLYYLVQPVFSHLVHNRRTPIRNSNQSPFRLRLKSKFNKTKLGKLNLKSHIMWENFRNKFMPRSLFFYSSKLRINWLVKATISLGSGAFIALIYAEGNKAFQSDGIRWYTLQQPYLFQDRVYMYLRSVKNPKYANHILDWELKNRIYSEKNDVLDYIQYGKLMSSALQEEIAFHCYYIAYLKDHDNLKTNAESDFETFIINKS